MSAQKQWVPLESNPDVLTRLGHALGLPPHLIFTDVFSLDLLDMVPAPRHAVLLLFPLTPKLLATPPTTPPTAPPAAPPTSTQPYFCRQTIANACGTIALLHAALNQPSAPRPGSFLHAFAARTAALDPTARADCLQTDPTLDAVHATFAAEGQTDAPPAGAAVDLHFVCFVEHQGALYELDGRNLAPLYRGPCPPARLLETAADVILNAFMKRDPDEHRFTILALTDAPPE